MFKKIILSLLLAVTPFVFSSAFAIQFTAVSETQFNQSSNDTPFWRLTVAADEHDEVTVEHGLNFVLPRGEAIQWDKTKNFGIQLSGSAANKVIATEPKFFEDLKVLHLDVQMNFDKDDELHLTGLTPRTFRKAVSSRPLGLDINGNFYADLENFYPFLVKDAERSDFIPPYDPEGFHAEYKEAQKEVVLTWKNPPDYDFWQVAITRERTVDGKKEKLDAYSGHEEMFIDRNLKDGEVKYVMNAVDTWGNNSGAVQVILTIGDPPPPEDPHVPTPPPAPTPPVTPSNQDKEITSLTKLFDYYYIRYQIKCLATGADPEGSLCLANKIDLIYAQEKLGKVKALSAVITARDKYLMDLRLKWPQKRHEDNCVKAATKANYCTALRDSLDRQMYFINKK